MKKEGIALMLSCVLLGSSALADTVSFDGTVEASRSTRVVAPVGGMVDEIPVSVGETVTAETVIARIKTNKVYASQAGTVTAVYGQPGDSVENIAGTWGAVMYLEGETLFTVSASTSRAYDDKANYIVHSGETVYLVSRNHTMDKGEGTISEVTDTSFTVRVSSGDFYVGDSVDIFREEDALAASRIGRGTVNRVAPEAVSGTGSIVSFAVSAGACVERGQLLFETVDGTFAGLEMSGTEILAGTEGTIASLNAEEGGSLAAESTVAEIYPRDEVRIALSVPEADLKELSVGQKVRVELDWNQDEGVSYDGVVESVSALGSAGTEGTVFTVYVSFAADANTRYGMTAVVTTLEEADETEAAEKGSEPAETAAAPAEKAEAAGETDDEAETQNETGNPGDGENASGRKGGGRRGRPGEDGERPSEASDGEPPAEGGESPANETAGQGQ